MDAQQALTHFVQRCLSPDKARRFSELVGSKKGKRKVLAGLYHEFEFAVRPETVRGCGYSRVWDSPCFVFHETLGFGVEFTSVREAYDHLSLKDGWLILLCDASAGIHRPEAPRWDHEKLIAG